MEVSDSLEIYQYAPSFWITTLHTLPSMTDYTVAVVGPVGVGKSAMVIQFACGQFVPDYDPEIEGFHHGQLILDCQNVKLDVFDTVEQDPF